MRKEAKEKKIPFRKYIKEFIPDAFDTMSNEKWVSIIRDKLAIIMKQFMLPLNFFK